MTNKKITITTLTPVHIGNGEELRAGFDFISNDKLTYRLNEDAILQAKSSLLKPDPKGVYPLPGNLITQADLGQRDLFRYLLAGVPRSKKEDARLQGNIKDVHDRPYIPGSSLKGAIRTALAWSKFPHMKPSYKRSDMERHKGLAEKIEEGIFGRDPNHDLLRALKISDCHPSSTHPSIEWMVVNATVINNKKPEEENLLRKNTKLPDKEVDEIPVELEAIPGNRIFEGSWVIEDFLFEGKAGEMTGFDQQRSWLDETSLLGMINARSQKRIEFLLDWFSAIPETEKVYESYRNLLYSIANLSQKQAIIQFGWGCGWDGTTFWNHLTDEDQLFQLSVQEFHKQRLNKQAEHFKNLRASFPSSRRVISQPIKQQDDAQKSYLAAAPLGWVLMTLT